MLNTALVRMLLLASTVLGSLLTVGSARATYSIIAFEGGSGQVGGAGTSCVGSFAVSAIYGVVPGVGVVAAQASLNEQARDRAVMLLDQGASAADVIADITSAGFDFFSDSRQYAVIDVAGLSAVGFTGASTMAFADDVQGNVAPYVYSVQGNILTSAAVLSQASAVFDAPGCDLAETLMLALEAGAMNGEGDSRCTPDGIPSDAAFIEVNLADQGAGQPFLSLEVTDTSPNSPVVELRALFDAWRATHPCPELEPNDDAGMPVDAGAQDAGEVDVPVEQPQAGSMAPPVTAGVGAGTSGVGAAGIGGAGGMAAPAPMPMTQEPTPAAPQSASDGSGCSIARPARASTFTLALAAVLAALRLRRRARR